MFTISTPSGKPVLQFQQLMTDGVMTGQKSQLEEQDRHSFDVVV